MSPEEVLQAASEKVSAAKSMTCETTTQMKMSAGGQSIQMTMTGELETTMDPVAMHMDMTDKSKLAVQQGLKELEILKKSLMQQYFG